MGPFWPFRKGTAAMPDEDEDFMNQVDGEVLLDEAAIEMDNNRQAMWDILCEEDDPSIDNM
eukprot:8584386-Karenia_brevis.AAC.1